MLYDILAIRRATVKDTDRVAEIHTKMWRHAYKAFLPPHFLDSISLEEKKKFRKRLLENANTDTEHYIAEFKGKILGFCDFGPGKDEDVESKAGQIYALYVDPQSMRLRVGERLLDEALKQLHAKGFLTVSLWVIAKNAIGRSFYEKHGFVFDGTQKAVTDHGVTYDVVRYKRAITKVV